MINNLYTQRLKTDLYTYLAVIGTCIIIWSLINVTNGYDIFNENQLNIAKGFVGLFQGFFMVMVKPYITMNMVKGLMKGLI